MAQHTNWPRQAQVKEYYGNPQGRGGAPSHQWELQNLTTLVPPFAMHFAARPVTRIRIHRKCAESLARILAAIWKASGENQAVIDTWGASTYGGAYNFRLMRNSTSLSMHAFGCAIDLAPERFPMGFGQRRFCAEVCAAFAAEGWVNLPFDRMHFQAARL